MALSRIYRAMDYPVTVVVARGGQPRLPGCRAGDGYRHGRPGAADAQHLYCGLYAGENDEDALQQALESELPGISFVPAGRSHQRRLPVLRQQGLTFEQPAGENPAGLDINAKLPEEDTISILLK